MLRWPRGNCSRPCATRSGLKGLRLTPDRAAGHGYRRLSFGTLASPPRFYAMHFLARGVSLRGLGDDPDENPVDRRRISISRFACAGRFSGLALRLDLWRIRVRTQV